MWTFTLISNTCEDSAFGLPYILILRERAGLFLPTYGIPSSLLLPLKHRNNFIVLNVDLNTPRKGKIFSRIVTGHRV